MGVCFASKACQSKACQRSEQQPKAVRRANDHIQQACKSKKRKKPIQVKSLSTARREIAVVACIVTQSLVFSGPNSPQTRGIVSLMLPTCSFSPSGASGRRAEGFGLMGVLEASRLRRDRRQAPSAVVPRQLLCGPILCILPGQRSLP